jgi:hypothetical protein
MTKHLFKPGESGNPAGRPPKSRALTAILERALNKTIDSQGKRVARKRLIAQAVAQAVATGKADMPDGTQLELSPRDWMEFTKWLYTHVDGGPVQRQEITGANGEAVLIRLDK